MAFILGLQTAGLEPFDGDGLCVEVGLEKLKKRLSETMSLLGRLWGRRSRAGIPFMPVQLSIVAFTVPGLDVQEIRLGLSRAVSA